MFIILKPDSYKYVWDHGSYRLQRNLLLFWSLTEKSDAKAFHLLRISATKWIGLNFNTSYYPSTSAPIQKSSKVLNHTSKTLRSPQWWAPSLTVICFYFKSLKRPSWGNQLFSLLDMSEASISKSPLASATLYLFNKFWVYSEWGKGNYCNLLSSFLGTEN